MAYTETTDKHVIKKREANPTLCHQGMPRNLPRLDPSSGIERDLAALCSSMQLYPSVKGGATPEPRPDSRHALFGTP